MSNKKSTIALFSKRKTFRSIFIKYWLIILVISALIYTLGLTFFAGNAKRHIQDAFYDVKSRTVEYTNSYMAESDITTQSNSLNLRFCTNFHSRGIPSLLYDKDTGDIIAGCQEQIFIIGKINDADVILACPTDKIPGWTDHYERLEKHCTLLNYTGEDLDIPYFYTDGNNFIPDAFIANSYSYGRFDYEPEENLLFSTNFDVPNHIPDNFERYTYSRDEFLPAIAIGYHKNSPNFHPLYNADINAAYNYLMDTYEQAASSDKISSADKINEDTFTLSMSSCTEFVTSSGRQVVLINAIDYNVLTSYKFPLLVIAIALLFAGLGLAFLLSRIAYIRLKVQYDMEDYRKTLINTMAHDLKSPLMSISGYAENLLNNVHSEKREHYANAILENIQHTNQIIESVLTLSKTESNIKLSKENVNVADLINKCIPHFELPINEKKLSFEITGSSNISADPALFTEVIRNIVGNAVKFATPESTINISLDKSQISIENYCTHIPKTNVAELMQPFVTGDSSRSNKSGNGLGLAIVKNICDLHKFTLKINIDGNRFVATILTGK